MTTQCAGCVWMVRPAVFYRNAETAETNKFQQGDNEDYTEKALEEFDAAVAVLTKNKIPVIVSESDDVNAPDAVFPNNWISYLPGEIMVLYPMLAESRRRERNLGVPAEVSHRLSVKKVLDYSAAELKNEFLEGTGSIVFDHVQKLAYACRSPRTSEKILKQLCDAIGYTAVVFDAADKEGLPVYHTNVLMSIGESTIVLCGDAIAAADRAGVEAHLKNSGRQIIQISIQQMYAFAGNMLQVRNSDGELCWIASSTALKSLDEIQVAHLATHSQIVEIALPVIEKYGGGSIRCMLAEIFI